MYFRVLACCKEFEVRWLSAHSRGVRSSAICAIYSLHRCMIQHALKVAILQAVILQYRHMARVLCEDQFGMMQVHLIDRLDIQQPRGGVKDFRVDHVKSEVDDFFGRPGGDFLRQLRHLAQAEAAQRSVEQEKTTDAFHWDNFPLLDEVVKGARWQRLVEETVEPLSAHDKFRVVGGGIVICCRFSHAVEYALLRRKSQRWIYLRKSK